MRPQRIIRPDTAFSVARPSTKRRPRDKNEDHLKFLRRLPCAACGTRRNIEAAHIRMASPVHGKRETGKGEKPSDMWTLPLCRVHHKEQHAIGEAEFWKMLRLNPCDLALALKGCTGDDDLAETVIRLQKARRADCRVRGSGTWTQH